MDDSSSLGEDFGYSHERTLELMSCVPAWEKGKEKDRYRDGDRGDRGAMLPSAVGENENVPEKLNFLYLQNFQDFLSSLVKKAHVKINTVRSENSRLLLNCILRFSQARFFTNQTSRQRRNIFVYSTIQKDILDLPAFHSYLFDNHSYKILDFYYTVNPLQIKCIIN